MTRGVTLIGVIAFLVMGVNAWGATSLNELSKIQITAGKGSVQVKLFATGPLTYTYYKSAPLQAIVDLAQTAPGPTLADGEVKTDLFAKVVVTKKEMPAITITRIVFSLKEDLTMAVQVSPEDKARLLVTFIGQR